eukprot:4418466-Pyramimonas_sp.AAC.1
MSSVNGPTNGQDLAPSHEHVQQREARQRGGTIAASRDRASGGHILNILTDGPVRHGPPGPRVGDAGRL